VFEMADESTPVVDETMATDVVEPVVTSTDMPIGEYETVTQESDEPPETPFQELAWSEDEIVWTPIPIEQYPSSPEEDAVATPYVPQPAGLTISVAPGERMNVCQRLPYDRIVTVLTIGDATYARFYYQFGGAILDQMIVESGNLTTEIPVHANMELWVEHDTVVYQQMSFNITHEMVG
jgi:hypothetical protein